MAILPPPLITRIFAPQGNPAVSENKSRFVDYVKIHVKAGDGGDGAVAFLREKFVPFGGPAGGDGGRGGSVILRAEEELMTLLDLKMRTNWVAERGQNGGKKNMSGRSGKDVTLKVPLGTQVLDADTGEEIGDLTTPGQLLVVAAGGGGGKGNQHFATPTNRAPRKAYPGTEGEERNIILELKVIAEAGLVGLPNAGKSTLLAAITSANPKIGAYPFTTLSPNLGVFMNQEFERRITVADIPGLIEGAHSGHGLGDRFLRHIERTKVLLHLIGPESGETPEGEITLANADAESLLYAYELVTRELEQYSASLLDKPKLVCLTKIDLISDEQQQEIIDAFAEKGIDLFLLSAEDGRGLAELKLKIEELVVQQEVDENTDEVEEFGPLEE